MPNYDLHRHQNKPFYQFSLSPIPQGRKSHSINATQGSLHNNALNSRNKQRNTGAEHENCHGTELLVFIYIH